MKKRAKKATVMILLAGMVLGSGLSVQADSSDDIKPVIRPSVEQYETCSTPLCYDGHNLQKVIVTITTHSDGSTTIKTDPTGICCR